MMCTEKDIKRHLDIAAKQLKSKDAFLLEHGVNERSITHKFAEYIQQQFKDYNVDCEYNRMKSDEIGIPFIEKRLRLEIKDVQTCDTSAKTVFPDIIVHERGTNENNLIVIEAKKQGGSKADRVYDLKKLKGYKDEIKYQFAVFIEFSSSGATIEIIQ